MSLALSPDVHAARVRDDLVFLDVGADAYYCLAGGGETLALDEAAGLVAGPAETLSQLLDAGLLSKEAAARSPSRAPAPLDRNLRREWRPLACLTLRGAVLVFSTGLRSRRDIERLGLAQLLAAARAEPTAPTRRLDLAQAVATFEALRPWAPFDGDCLFRAYWQLLFLKALGHGEVRWVFGVRTFPFLAHCWLQSGDQVINDDPDTLAGYRRIMAV